MGLITQLPTSRNGYDAIFVTTSTSIVSDRDPRFASTFWGSLHKKTGTTLAMSTATDGPTRKLNPKYCGPFTITQAISPVAFKLALPANMRQYLQGRAPS